MNTFRMFLTEVGQYPLLSAAEEKELAYRYRDNHDEDAREYLINCNMRLVINIAKNYNNNHMELMDLIAEGSLGLMQAVEKFNPDLGYRFSTCATPWIKQAITKAIIDKGRNIRTPAHIYQQLNKYRQAIAELTTEDNPKPTAEEIAEYMGITPEKVADLENWRYDTVSLSTPIGEEEEDTLEDMQADGGETPQQYTERLKFEGFVQDRIKELKPRTQTIVKMRFGLGAAGDPEEFFEEHTLEEIGDYIGISRERVRQVLKDALAELKIDWKKKI